MPQPKVEVAQPEVEVPQPEVENHLPRRDVADRKILPAFTPAHWERYAGITDACDLRYEGDDLSTVRLASSYPVPSVNDKPFTLDPQLIQKVSYKDIRYQDQDSVKKSMKEQITE